MIAKNEIISTMNERLAHQDAEIKVIKCELINLAAADAQIIEQVNNVDKKLDDAKTVLLQQINESREEMRHVLTINGIKQDETNDKLSQLLESFNNIGKSRKVDQSHE